jgi:hypothetical protein
MSAESVPFNFLLKGSKCAQRFTQDEGGSRPCIDTEELDGFTIKNQKSAKA